MSSTKCVKKYEYDMALNSIKLLICNETKTNQSKPKDPVTFWQKNLQWRTIKLG